MDHTKAWWYVLLDILSKILPATAAVLIGWIGIRFQNANARRADEQRGAERREEQRQKDADRESARRAELGKRLLPMLDALVALESSLDAALTAGSFADPAGWPVLAEELYWRSESLYVPAGVASEVKLPSARAVSNAGLFYPGRLDDPAAHRRALDWSQRRVPLRHAVLHAAEFLMAGKEFHSITRSPNVELVQVDVDRSSSELTLRGLGPGPNEVVGSRTVELDGLTVDVWKGWLQLDAPFQVNVWGDSVRAILLGLRREVARLQKDAVEANPDLARDYVLLRERAGLHRRTPNNRPGETAQPLPTPAVPNGTLRASSRPAQ
jgi:hypothetical protein